MLLWKWVIRVYLENCRKTLSKKSKKLKNYVKKFNWEKYSICHKTLQSPSRSHIGSRSIRSHRGLSRRGEGRFRRSAWGKISGIRPHYTLIVLGDLKDTTDTDRSGFESMVGRFGSRDIEPNDNSMWMLSLCSSAGLTVMGSWFKWHDVHRWSWYSNDGHTKKKIEHICARQRDRGLVTACRVYRGAEALPSTDPRLRVANIKMQMPFLKSVSRGSKRLNVNRLSFDISV